MANNKIQYTLFICFMFFTFNSQAEVSINKFAPYFELFDQGNKLHKLSDYSGKWLVLYFYPKDDTPGCTTEACSFRDDIYKIRELNAEVVGISTDDIKSHAEFAKKYNLPFALLSDEGANLAYKYGAAWKLGPLSMAKRHSFIISPEGKILKIYRKVRPKKHSHEIISDLKALQPGN